MQLKNISTEREKYGHMVVELPPAMARLVLVLLEKPAIKILYSALKTKLLESHELANFERMKKLCRLELLGVRYHRSS